MNKYIAIGRVRSPSSRGATSADANVGHTCIATQGEARIAACTNIPPSDVQEAPVAAVLPVQVQVLARPALPFKVKPAPQLAQVYRHRTCKKPSPVANRIYANSGSEPDIRYLLTRPPVVGAAAAATTNMDMPGNAAQPSSGKQRTRWLGPKWLRGNVCYTK